MSLDERAGRRVLLAFPRGARRPGWRTAALCVARAAGAVAADHRLEAPADLEHSRRRSRRCANRCGPALSRRGARAARVALRRGGPRSCARRSRRGAGRWWRGCYGRSWRRARAHSARTSTPTVKTTRASAHSSFAGAASMGTARERTRRWRAPRLRGVPWRRRRSRARARRRRAARRPRHRSGVRRLLRTRWRGRAAAAGALGRRGGGLLRGRWLFVGRRRRGRGGSQSAAALPAPRPAPVPAERWPRAAAGRGGSRAGRRPCPHRRGAAALAARAATFWPVTSSAAV